MTLTVEPMHDQVWTERLLAGRTNELDNLAPHHRATGFLGVVGLIGLGAALLLTASLGRQEA